MKALPKRMLALCACLLLMILVIPNVVFASGKDMNANGDDDDWWDQFYSGSCGKNVSWHYGQDGTLTISGTGPMDDYMSEYVTDHSVAEFTGEGIPWKDCDVKKLVIEEGVTKIGNGAFFNLKIPEVTLPSTIKEIGVVGFGLCQNLKSITLPDFVETIGMYAFSSCYNLKTVSLSKQLKQIPYMAFYNCGLETCEIPENVSYISSFAFRDCESLEKAIVPESVSCIDEYAFMGCSKLSIYGKSGSEAERYALQEYIPFVTDEKFTVTFKDDNGNVISEQSVPYGKDAVPPEVPSKKSDDYYTYDFLYWDIDYSNVRSNLVVNAVYDSKVREYTVTFDANGGQITGNKEVTVTYGSQLGTLPTCTRAGYKFKGWFTAKKKGDKVTTTTEVTADETLYAQWKKIR